MNQLIFTLAILFVLYFVTVYLGWKYINKIRNENQLLSKAVQRQREVINAFNKAERKAAEEKAKLGKGSVDDRVNTSINILQDIEARR